VPSLRIVNCVAQMCKANKYLLVKNYEMLLFIKVWESISKEQAMTTESQITMF